MSAIARDEFAGAHPSVIAAAEANAFVKTTGMLREDDPGFQDASRTQRRSKLRDIERQMREKWDREDTFREDAPDPAADAGAEKFFCTFPYPYMNGRLHLGHAFTITKADFAAGYHRLKGRRVLFPFAFHCTGMPIQAAAYKLKQQIQRVGVENCMNGIYDAPSSKEEEEEKEEKRAAAAAAAAEESPSSAAAGGPKVFKGGKTKLMAKTGGKGKRKPTQWEILQMCHVPDAEIPNFVDPTHWLRYFPPHGLADLKCFGLHTDWRRSFITTDVNPFYDSFIRWQFRRLRASGKIAFGKRPTIYSRRDKQACMDHDRASGEGKGFTEYTLIKMRLLPDGARTLASRAPAIAGVVEEGTPIFLVAATLRPETMYGQTNCFVLPTGNYGAYRMRGGEIYVCSDHSAVNMAHQVVGGENMMATWGETDKVADLTGMDLMGLPLKAPNAPYEKVYTLPLLTILMNKGTGVVTSVPSDAPDDYAALRDMQTKPELREKYGITEDMVRDYKPVPILNIPGGCADLNIESWGEMAAVTGCEALGVRDQHDKNKLKKIKDAVYLLGFNDGVMTVGSQKGVKVEIAKPLVKQEMISNGDASRYYEPEEEIMSRSGDKCIVASIDQWYLKYGEPAWRDAVLEHVRDKEGADGGSEAKEGASKNTFRAYGVRNEYVNTLGWLKDWACSRSFGLGTRVPWDEQFVVESLSDSTIYMAYYTVAHLLQGLDNVDGSKPGPLGISAADLDDGCWDYIFCKGPYADGCKVSEEHLEKMRNEFEFWYPLDLRVSGKDLVRNHLTMSLYNHAAIWPEDPSKWPRSFFTNGHVMVDAEKMSKSKGNFISLHAAIAGDNVHLHVPIKKSKQQITVTNEATGKTRKKKVEVTTKLWKDAKWRAQSWTVDTVRFALAKSGDTMNDANFETDIANKRIIDLENEMIWCAETLESESGLRTGEFSIQDKVLQVNMDRCIEAADGHYANMRFSQAVKCGFEDLRVARKTYRDYHDKCGLKMHRDVVRRFVEVQAILICPVITHWSEYIWCNVLKNKGTVTRAPWPKLSGESTTCLLQDDYLQGVIKSCRAKITKQQKKKKKKKGKKGKASEEEKKQDVPMVIQGGSLFVQREFPQWRKTLLTWLDARWDETTSSFAEPKSLMSDAAQLQKTDEGMQEQGKMFMKVVSGIVAATKKRGREALATEMPFDELTVLSECKEYIGATLEMPRGVSICNASDFAEDADAQKSEPGAPAFQIHLGPKDE